MKSVSDRNDQSSPGGRRPSKHTGIIYRLQAQFGPNAGCGNFRQRHIAITNNDFLTLARQHHAEELALERREIPVRILVHVHIEKPRQRIITGRRVFLARGKTLIVTPRQSVQPA